MVSNQIDIVLQQALDPDPFHATDGLILTFPEIPVMHQNHVGIGFDRRVHERPGSRDATYYGTDLFSALDLQAIRAIVLEVLRGQPVVQCAEYLIA